MGRVQGWERVSGVERVLGLQTYVRDERAVAIEGVRLVQLRRPRRLRQLLLAMESDTYCAES